jgi:arginyl-tRNA synthetase
MIKSMQTLTKIIEAKFRESFNISGVSPESPVILVEASKPEFGDYQVNGVMAAAKLQKINPRILAQKIVDNLDLNTIAKKIEIAGAGFINITIDDVYLANYIAGLNAKNKFGLELAVDMPQTVIVDYSSPNLAKEMHVGHLRSTVIGDAIATILEYMGNIVIKQNHVGDWGTQFGMLIAYMIEKAELDASKSGLSTNPENHKSADLVHTIGDLEEFYRNAKVSFDEDKNFADKARYYVVILQNWQNEGAEGIKVFNYWTLFKDASLKHCEEVYNKLNVKLTRDNVAPESMYNDKLDSTIQSLYNNNLIKESNGAKCIFFAEGELSGGESTPFIVQKQDGGYLYSTTDLAAMNYRVHTLKGDRVLYVVDARQAFHFKQLFIAGYKAGFAKDNTILEHTAFGTMMNEDGKPFKTRSGGTVKLIDVINEAILRAKAIVLKRNPDWSEADRESLANKLAIAAIKYADLSKNRTSDYIFSFDKMLAFDGNTAPYLLYAYTRIKSLVKKVNQDASQDLIERNKVNYKIKLTEHKEHKLALHLANFADMLFITANESYPHYLCQYLYNLAGLFMQFYESCPILKAESSDVRFSRLALADLTSEILAVGLNLLGIETVERM